MIRWLIFSIVLHGLLFFTAWRQSGRVVFKKPKVIQVALIKVAQPPKASEPEVIPEKPAEPEIKETPKPVAVKKTPKPKKSEPVKEVVKKEEEVKEVERPEKKGPQIQVDGVIFPFNYYLEMLHKRIQENWHPPFQGHEEGGPTTAVVVFRIERNGQIGDVKLEKKAGNFVYDQAVKRTIFNLGKLPPLPGEFEGDYLNMHVEFETL